MSARQWQGRKANRNAPGSLEVNQTAVCQSRGLTSKTNSKRCLSNLWQDFKAGEYSTMESIRCN
jgi:hypothetical protein